MATAIKRLGFFTRVLTTRPPCRTYRRPTPHQVPAYRPQYFSTSQIIRTENRPDDGESVEPFPASGGGAPLQGDAEDDGILDEGEEIADIYEAEDGIFIADDDLDTEDIEEEGEDEEDADMPVYFDMDEVESELDSRSRRQQIDPDEEEDDALWDEDEDLDEQQEEPNWPPNFYAMDEERDDPGEEPDFDHDDITSLAHGELEQHRELREFARVMAWDMPLLFNQARQFEPPTAAQPLRFRYTTYLGEAHPAARKVVLTFTPTALPDLTPLQSSKLIKLLGVRYNPSTSTAKMSCELFPTTAQNKRYLGDMLDKLLHECRTGEDTFADVPFDFRHHKPKKQFLFPEAWKLTPERRQALEQRREQLRLAEESAVANGQIVQGANIVEQALRSPAASEREAVMQVAAGKAAGQRNAPQQRRASSLR